MLERNLWYAYAVMKVDWGLENAMFRKENSMKFGQILIRKPK